MTWNFIILFFTSLAAGSLAVFIPQWKEKDFRMALIFAGAYLFSITILHLLPELFGDHDTAYFMGLFILLGFLLQQVLDYLSSGIEHGHIHHPGGHGMGNSVWSLMIGLFLHAFLEGTLLSKQPTLLHHHHGSETLLIGILLHKMPEAFALVAVLLTRLNKQKTFALLILFSLASPIGMLSTDWLYGNAIIGSGAINVLFGLVAGGFLHISTTIFFESSPQHKLQLKKLLVILLASGLAILSEYVI